MTTGPSTLLLVFAACIDAVEPTPSVRQIPDLTMPTPEPTPRQPTGPTGETGIVEPGWTGVPSDRPLRLLFLGNSFTLQGPVPDLVGDLAADVGWPAPEVALVAIAGQNLSFHRVNPDSLAQVDMGSWDAVVLQDVSTRPTDAAGDPEAFKADATWLYDRIKETSPDATVVLYETWARQAGHPLYPDTFVDPADMQAQLRKHYYDAADAYIPAQATAMPSDDVVVAPVGDAWEAHLAEPDALVLHDTDLHHASATGQRLNAMVLYSTIYGVVAAGAGDLGLPAADADRLQTAADATTGITVDPPAFPLPSFEVGRTVQVDFGVVVTPGWTTVSDCQAGSARGLVDTEGVATGVSLRIIDNFNGTNALGIDANDVGVPGTVSQDVCWVGSFDGHDAALVETAVVELDHLAPGVYTMTLFASRTGDDLGLGRLTRYEIAGQSADLEVSDNTEDMVVFEGLVPDASGQLSLFVRVSPEGSARFGYLGALTLTKVSD